jgi:hypothetical protein
VKKKDRHNASKSGSKSEIRLANKFKQLGHNLTKYKEPLENIGLFGMHRLPIPPSMQGLDSTKEFSYFEHDGIVKDLKLLVESKYSEKKGSTEEKIFYDLHKIEQGVYSNDKSLDLWYIIWGPQAKVQPIFAYFQQVAEQRSLPVKVIRINDLNELDPFIVQRKKELAII